MRPMPIRSTLVGMALLASTGCAGDAPQQTSVPAASAHEEPVVTVVAAADQTSWQDARLGALVTEQLVLDPWIDASQVGVSVSDGVVRLAYRDIAPDSAERARQLVALVPGVARVDAELPESPAGSGQPAAAEADDLRPPTTVELLEPSTATIDVVALGTPRALENVAEAAAETDGSGQIATPTSDVARAASGDRPRTYRVRAGETLSLIARRTMGDGNAWPRIYELNRSLIGPNPEAIAEGMELRIPQD